MTDRSDYYRRNYAGFLPDDRKASILDIGCGQGDLVRFLSHAGFSNVTAVDRDADAVSRLDALPGITARSLAVDATNVPRRRGGWELIVAKQMLYYFDRRDAPAFVRALADALAPNGRLVVEIFNGALLSSRFTEAKDPGILTAYSELGLRRLLEQNDLEIERIADAAQPPRGLLGLIYAVAQALWFRLYRLVLILERGRDDELPRSGCKTIIAVAHRR